jgi:hypothetical protein
MNLSVSWKRALLGFSIAAPVAGLVLGVFASLAQAAAWAVWAS